jgi:hypothetical protein
MIIATGYVKITHPYRPKLYLPNVTIDGVQRATNKTAFSRARDAEQYAERLKERYNRLCDAKDAIDALDEVLPLLSDEEVAELAEQLPY